MSAEDWHWRRYHAARRLASVSTGADRDAYTDEAARCATVATHGSAGTGESHDRVARSLGWPTEGWWCE